MREDYKKFVAGLFEEIGSIYMSVSWKGIVSGQVRLSMKGMPWQTAMEISEVLEGYKGKVTRGANGSWKSWSAHGINGKKFLEWIKKEIGDDLLLKQIEIYSSMYGIDQRGTRMDEGVAIVRHRLAEEMKILKGRRTQRDLVARKARLENLKYKKDAEVSEASEAMIVEVDKFNMLDNRKKVIRNGRLMIKEELEAERVRKNIESYGEEYDIARRKSNQQAYEETQRRWGKLGNKDDNEEAEP